MKRFLACLLLFPALGLSSAEVPERTIHFDEIDASAGWKRIANGYAGLLWENFGIINGLDQSPASGYRNGVRSPENVAFNVAGDPATIASAQPFIPVTAWLAAHVQEGLQVEITGLLEGTVQFTRSYTLSTQNVALVEFERLPVNELRFKAVPETIFAMDDLTVLLRPAHPHFVPGAPITAPAAAASVAAGDLNADGRTDLLIGLTNGISVRVGLKDGGFANTPQIYTSGIVEGVTVADYDGDGVLEGIWSPSAVYSIRQIPARDTFNLLILQTSSAGGLNALGDAVSRALPEIYFTRPAANDIASGDLNQDGRIDIVKSSNAPESLTVTLLQTRDSFLPFEVPTDPAEPLEGLALGDWDGDGDLDIAAASPLSGGVTVFYNNPTPRPENRFDQRADFSAGLTLPTGVAAADMNGDRHLDLVVRSRIGGVSLLYGTGTGQFEAGVVLAQGYGTPDPRTRRALAVDDLNQDGRPDIVYVVGGHVETLLNILPPRIEIARLGDLIHIQWLTNFAAGVVLEATPTLGPNSDWQEVPFPTLHSGDRRSVFTSGHTPTKFFRLRRP